MKDNNSIHTNLNANQEHPKLAAPGAGLPYPQKFFLRYFVKPFVAAKTPWEVSQERFLKISEKILKEIEGLTDQQLSTRVLVPSHVGIEDSSRFWSIAMTLEHIAIVGRQIAFLLPELTKEIIPDAKADIAAVKPKGALTAAESVEDFKKFITEDFAQLNSSIVNKNSNALFYHPWFGYMRAQQWYWLLATHHGLHLKQIRAIKKRLPLI